MKIFQAIIVGAFLCAVPVSVHAKDKKMNGPEVVEIADISIGLSGLVCDFCSIALNKTFKKRDEVKGTYVDLDTKIMSVALKEGEDIADEDIVSLVKKAGYSTTKITRKDGRVFIPSKT